MDQEQKEAFIFITRYTQQHGPPPCETTYGFRELGRHFSWPTPDSPEMLVDGFRSIVIFHMVAEIPHYGSFIAGAFQSGAYALSWHFEPHIGWGIYFAKDGRKLKPPIVKHQYPTSPGADKVWEGVVENADGRRINTLWINGCPFVLMLGSRTAEPHIEFSAIFDQYGTRLIGIDEESSQVLIHALFHTEAPEFETMSILHRMDIG